MRDKVITTPVKIYKKGEIKTFQIKIPSDAKRITGVELVVDKVEVEVAAGGGWAPPAGVPGWFIEFQPSSLVGEVKLKSNGTTNFFYGAHVWLDNASLGQGDYTLSVGFQGQEWSHGRRREVEPLNVKVCWTVIEGVFRDYIGTKLDADFPYTVSVHLWYSIEYECEKTEVQ